MSRTGGFLAHPGDKMFGMFTADSLRRHAPPARLVDPADIADAAIPAAPVGLRRRACLGWLGLSALAASGCVPAPRPPLTVGFNAWVGYDPLVLARDRRLLEPAAVKVIELPTAADTQRHLRNGLLDAAGLTLDEALRLADGGLDLRIAAVCDTSEGSDVVMAAPTIRAVRDLAGAFVAVEDSSVGALLLQRMLESAGLDRTAVKVVNLEATLHLAALQAGEVAAAVSYAPLATELAVAGFRPLFDSRQIPGEIVDVLAVRASVAQERPDAVDALLRGWYGGLSGLQRDPAGAAQLLAPGTDLRPDDYLAVLGGLRFLDLRESLAWLRPQPGPAPAGGEAVVGALKRMGLLARAPDWARLLDPAPAERLLAAGGAP